MVGFLSISVNMPINWREVGRPCLCNECCRSVRYDEPALLSRSSSVRTERYAASSPEFDREARIREERESAIRSYRSDPSYEAHRHLIRLPGDDDNSSGNETDVDVRSAMRRSQRRRVN